MKLRKRNRTNIKEISDMKKKKKYDKDTTQFLCEVYVTKNSYPHQMGLGNKGTAGSKFTPTRDLVIKGRPSNQVNVITLTEQGWKDLRKLCRKAIKEFEHGKSKES